MYGKRIRFYCKMVTFFLSFLFLLFFMGCFNELQATEYGIMPIDSLGSDGYYVVHNDFSLVHNEEFGQYECNTTVYLYDGKHELSFVLPDDMYNNTKGWFVYYDYSAKQLRYVGDRYSVDSWDKYNYNFRLYKNGNNYENGFSLGSSVQYSYYYPYDFSSNSWDKSSKIYLSRGFNITPNSIILIQSDKYVYYCDSDSLKYGYTELQDNQGLIAPRVWQKDKGFRVYLYDFYSHSTIAGNLNRDLTLENIVITVHDMLGSAKDFTLDDLLSVRDVESEERGTDSEYPYYIDCNLSDLGISSILDSDYLLSFTFNLRSYQHNNKISDDITVFDTSVLYNYTGYWRYQYDSNSGVGLLYRSDKDGNIQEEVTPSDPDDSKPSFDDSNIVNGLNGVQNSVNNLDNSINQQTEAIEEQTEVQKNIFQRLLDIPGMIIEGLLNLFKSIFIPSDDFLDNYFNELYEWFCDRLGFLSYPVELFVDILNKFLNINWGEPSFNIPDINEPFSNEKLISATSYNLNSLLENETLKNVHDIYLILVDAVIIFALVNLAKNKFEEVTKS